MLPTKDDISDSLATVGLAHKDKVKQRQIVGKFFSTIFFTLFIYLFLLESDTFDWV